jgi:hypothetical protein
MQRQNGLAAGFSISFFDARDLVLQQRFWIRILLSPQFTCPSRVMSVDHSVQAGDETVESVGRTSPGEA